jgi:hypothetical protein
MHRKWTREEADRALPELREILAVLVEQKKVADLAEQALRELQRRAQGNGHGLGRELDHRQARLREALSRVRQGIEQIRRMGCEIKDLDTGLIDFPSELDGRPVLLCWQLGEPSVMYWHDPETGFAGRRPL